MNPSFLLPTLVILALALALPPAPQPAEAATAAAVADNVQQGSSPAAELKELKDRLPDKEAELAKLRRKWTVSKGRVPTEEELKEFEKKRAKGPTTVEDNPYVNKSPLSSPGYWRKAYYDKLAEIKADRERIRLLEEELGGRSR